MEEINPSEFSGLSLWTHCFQHVDDELQYLMVDLPNFIRQEAQAYELKCKKANKRPRAAKKTTNCIPVDESYKGPSSSNGSTISRPKRAAAKKVKNYAEPFGGAKLRQPDPIKVSEKSRVAQTTAVTNIEHSESSNQKEVVESKIARNASTVSSMGSTYLTSTDPQGMDNEEIQSDRIEEQPPEVTGVRLDSGQVVPVVLMSADIAKISNAKITNDVISFAKCTVPVTPIKMKSVKSPEIKLADEPPRRRSTRKSTCSLDNSPELMGVEIRLSRSLPLVSSEVSDKRDDVLADNPPETKRLRESKARTKVIKKGDSDPVFVLPVIPSLDDESVSSSVRTRTKVLKPKEPAVDEEVVEIIEENCNNETQTCKGTRSRTKILKTHAGATANSHNNAESAVNEVNNKDEPCSTRTRTKVRNACVESSSDVPAQKPTTPEKSGLAVPTTEEKKRTRVELYQNMIAQSNAPRLNSDLLLTGPRPTRDLIRTCHLIKTDTKENVRHKLKRSVSNVDLKKPTPLAPSNRITPLKTGTTLLGRINSAMKLNSAKRLASSERNEDSKRSKEDLALKKKNDIIQATREEKRRKREEKMQKVEAARANAEREKIEQQAKLEREREERERQALAEKERRKEEERLKKKMLNQQKAQEVEERRQKEEQARRMKLKEIEEEQKRQMEIRLKEQEEAERLYQKRLAEELRMKELSKAAKENKLQVKAIAKIKGSSDAEYSMTPPRSLREKLMPKDADDYGIDDLNPDDPSDDEAEPKKKVPEWAAPGLIKSRAKVQLGLSEKLMVSFFAPATASPDEISIFGSRHRFRPRTSSAVWNTPPFKV